MQNKQTGKDPGARHSPSALLAPLAPPTVVIHVVVVVVKNIPHARASAVFAAIQKGWVGREPQYDVRCQVLAAPTDKRVAAAIVDHVLPDVPRHRPVVVFCGNTCALLDVRLGNWVDRWVQSDRPLWATGDEGGNVQWGVFSGIASDLTSLLGEPAFRNMRMVNILARLQRRNHLLCDAAPLVNLGLGPPASDMVPHGFTREEFNGVAAQYLPPSALRLVAYHAYAATNDPKGRGTILAVAITIVLVVIICLLGAAVARAKRRVVVTQLVV